MFCNSFTSVTCIVPKSSTNNVDSTCQLKVTENNYETLTQFVYLLSLTPVVASVSPQRGGTGGGTLLTIDGSGFPNDANLVNVTIAGTKCIISTISMTQIMCRTEPFIGSSLSALVNVAIKNNGMALNVSTV